MSFLFPVVLLSFFSETFSPNEKYAERVGLESKVRQSVLKYRIIRVDMGFRKGIKMYRIKKLQWNIGSVKPIFHCNAKYLASGVGIGQCPQRQNFGLEIPTCWYPGANANL